MKRMIALAALLMLAGCTSQPPSTAPSTPSTTPSAPSTTPSAPSTTPSTPSTTPSTPGGSNGASAPPGLYPPDKRTGTDEIDRVLDAVAKRDVDALTAVAVMSKVPCTTHPGGMTASPTCAPGQADGTPVDLFPAPGCEPGGFDRLEQVRMAVKQLLSSPQYVYTVYKVKVTQGQYTSAYAVGLAMEMADQKAKTIFLDSKGKMISLRGGCGGPEQTVPQGADFILPPQNTAK